MDTGEFDATTCLHGGRVKQAWKIHKHEGAKNTGHAFPAAQRKRFKVVEATANLNVLNTRTMLS